MKATGKSQRHDVQKAEGRETGKREDNGKNV